jgi:DNA-binding transcriptional regulator YiaG
VFLSGIEVYRCGKCKLESPMIPQVAALNRLIAKAIVKKTSPLAGDQLRFLRKNAGISSQKFAALLGLTPSHLSRVENGKHQHLSGSADKLARAWAAVAVCREDARETVLKLASNLVMRAATKSNAKQVFVLEDNRWRKAAA